MNESSIVSQDCQLTKQNANYLLLKLEANHDCNTVQPASSVIEVSDS